MKEIRVRCEMCLHRYYTDTSDTECPLCGSTTILTEIKSRSTRFSFRNILKLVIGKGENAVE